MSEGKMNDLIVELNVIEAPIFNFVKRPMTMEVKELMISEAISIETKEVIEGIYKKNPNTEVEYKNWIDSKGKKRELIITSDRESPKAIAMDVFFALIKKLISDNHPVDLDESGNINFKSNKTNFTLYSLCKIMHKTPSKRVYKEIREAVLQLNSTNYYSVGALFNKQKNTFEDGRVRGVRLVDEINISMKNEDGELIDGTVKFSDMVMDNLRAGFARILRNDIYFYLKSGLTRALYLYIENNKGEIYTKRKIDVLSNKLPLPYKYLSEFKRKLNQPFNNLIENGIIKDYFWGDEFLINGVKEKCIYIIFKGTKKQLIDSLTKKSKDMKKEKQNNLEVDYELTFPEDINKELINLGINSKKIAEITKKYSKWKLAEYILWIKDGISKGKVKDPAAMFVFAIKDEMVKVKPSHPHIVEFVEKIKSEVEGKQTIDLESINKAYDDYLIEEIELFKLENEFIYESMIGTILLEIKSVQVEKIKGQRQMYNMIKDVDEKDKILASIEKWERFSSEGEDSDLFKEQLIKRIKLFRGLKNIEQFKSEYIQKNK